MGVETARSDRDNPHAAFVVRMLGPLTVERGGVAVPLPASRKLCALLAYLALSPEPVSRSRLCDLLWDLPNDPRSELRWCLSKIRAILDGPERHRVTALGDLVGLDLRDCWVDALEIDRRMSGGIDLLDSEALESLVELLRGDFLEGLEVSHSPHFDIWLTAQRRRFRSMGVTIVERLVERAPASSDQAEVWLARWIGVAPFDIRPHKLLLTRLAAEGRIREGEEHLAVSARAFEDEDVDFTPIRLFWRILRDGRRVTAEASTGPGPVPASDHRDGGGAHPDIATSRASLAVMPFAEEVGQGMRGGFADGLTHDIITRLAKLRNLFIIARGSVFALAERSLGPDEAGRRLGVNYVASGTARLRDGKAVVSVEVIEVPTARIVWTEIFEHDLRDMFAALDDIGDSIVASIAKEIEAAEQTRAVLKAPNSLNAWEAFHRGLWHMYRFTREDNRLAQRFFDASLKLDPTFARAHAGMSFTHWQNAFQRWEDREKEVRSALDAAGQSLLADDHNPSSHWAMGRALWMCGSQEEEALGELERAVELSPNFALGHYTLAFVHSQSGDPKLAIGSADQSRHLSPFDPLLFGMLAARGMAHVRLGEFEEAAQWALTAAARPNAHVIIRAIAAHCLGLAGRVEEGRAMLASIRKTHPDYCGSDFLEAFRFSPDAVALFRLGARKVGLD